MYLVAVINIRFFVAAANVRAEWLVVSCNTHLHLGDPSSPKRFLFSLAARLYPDFFSLAFTELWWIYGLINACSPRLSFTSGPYAQPLNLKGGQLSGPYVPACPTSQYWVKPGSIVPIVWCAPTSHLVLHVFLFRIIFQHIGTKRLVSIQIVRFFNLGGFMWQWAWHWRV